MALLGILKKKKKNELEIPPPPPIQEEQTIEIPDIKPQETTAEKIPLPKKTVLPPPIEPETLPEFPAMPELPAEEEEAKPIKKTEERIVYDKTVRSISEIPPQVMHRSLTAVKTFVSYDDYTEITNNNEIINTKLAEAESLIKKLNDLKNEENKIIEEWLDNLENTAKKLAQVDRMLAQSQS